MTYCFKPEHLGAAPHYTSPPRALEEFAGFCARVRAVTPRRASCRNFARFRPNDFVFEGRPSRPNDEHLLPYRGGELMLAVQLRGLAQLKQLRLCYRVVAVVSHGDVIRDLVAHFRGLHIDFLQRIEITPASITILELDDWGPSFA